MNQGPSVQINKFWCWWKQNLLALLLVLTSQHREHKRLQGNTSGTQPTHFPMNKETKITLPFSQFMVDRKIPWSHYFHNGLKFEGLGTSRIQTALSLESPIKPWYLLKCLTDYHIPPSTQHVKKAYGVQSQMTLALNVLPGSPWECEWSPLSFSFFLRRVGEQILIYLPMWEWGARM